MAGVGWGWGSKLRGRWELTEVQSFWDCRWAFGDFGGFWGAFGDLRDGIGERGREGEEGRRMKSEEREERDGDHFHAQTTDR